MLSLEISEPQTDLGGSSVQQDNGLKATIVGLDGSKAAVVGLFDGHGAEKGQHFSRLCKEQLECVINEENFKERFDTAPEQVGHEIFKRMHLACLEYNKECLTVGNIPFEERNGLLYTEDVSCIDGGSTATIIIAKDNGEIHCFNVGDSEAWFLESENAVQLHTDHLPETLSEYERIQAICPSTKHLYGYSPLCGVRRRLDGDCIFPPRNYFNGYYRKNVSGQMATIVEVSHGYDLFRLAMTRSIGDEPLRHGGISWEPSHVCYKTAQSGIIKIASDGYWDNLSETDIIKGTQQEIAKYGFDADKLNRVWFQKTEKLATTNFGTTRDNMWSYVITLKVRG